METNEITVSIERMANGRQVPFDQIHMGVVSWPVIEQLAQVLLGKVWEKIGEVPSVIVAVRVIISPQTHIHIEDAPSRNDFNQNGNDLGQGIFYEFKSAQTSD